MRNSEKPRIAQDGFTFRNKSIDHHRFMSIQLSSKHQGKSDADDDDGNNVGAQHRQQPKAKPKANPKTKTAATQNGV